MARASLRRLLEMVKLELAVLDQEQAASDAAKEALGAARFHRPRRQWSKAAKLARRDPNCLQARVEDAVSKKPKDSSEIAKEVGATASQVSSRLSNLLRDGKIKRLRHHNAYGRTRWQYIVKS